MSIVNRLEFDPTVLPFSGAGFLSSFVRGGLAVRTLVSDFLGAGSGSFCILGADDFSSAHRIDSSGFLCAELNSFDQRTDSKGSLCVSGSLISCWTADALDGTVQVVCPVLDGRVEAGAASEPE